MFIYHVTTECQGLSIWGIGVMPTPEDLATRNIRHYVRTGEPNAPQCYIEEQTEDGKLVRVLSVREYLREQHPHAMVRLRPA